MYGEPASRAPLYTLPPEESTQVVRRRDVRAACRTCGARHQVLVAIRAAQSFSPPSLAERENKRSEFKHSSHVRFALSELLTSDVIYVFGSSAFTQGQREHDLRRPARN